MAASLPYAGVMVDEGFAKGGESVLAGYGSAVYSYKHTTWVWDATTETEKARSVTDKLCLPVSLDPLEN